MIQVISLSKTYGNKKAIDSVEFQVEPGKVLGLLGPNGAGKTTTMRIMAGFLNSDSGDVWFDGISIQKHPREIQSRLGYLPENAPLYEDFFVSEYLEFIAKARDISLEHRNQKIERIVTLCSLEKSYYKPIHQLSKGYKQRVALAATLLHEPDFIILDEPSSGLDPNQITEIRNLIRDLGREKTLILSTHILQEVQEVCDRVVILSQGKKVLDSSVQDLAGESLVFLSTTLDLKTLREHLEKKGILGLVLVEDHQDGFKDYHIPSPQGGVPEVFQAIRDLPGEVRCLMPYHKSLETIFQELTK